MKGLASGSQVILYVSDMEASIGFWNGSIGLKLISPQDAEDWSQVYWAVLDGGGFELALHPGGQKGAKTSPAFSLYVYDIELAVADLESRGVTHSGIQNPHPGVIFCQLEDPDGHVFFIKPSG